MAVQVKRGKQTFLVGMDWEVAQDKSDAKALLKQAGKKSRIAISPTGDERTWFGYADRSQKGLAAAAVVAAVDQRGEIARSPTFLVDAFRFENLADEAKLIVRV